MPARRDVGVLGFVRPQGESACRVLLAPRFFVMLVWNSLSSRFSLKRQKICYDCFAYRLREREVPTRTVAPRYYPLRSVQRPLWSECLLSSLPALG